MNFIERVGLGKTWSSPSAVGLMKISSTSLHNYSPWNRNS